MTPRTFGMAVAFAAVILLIGCNGTSTEDDGSRPLTPKPVVFQGQVDSKFVGAWKTADNRSALNLGKDGNLEIIAVISTPTGNTTSKLAGTWLASGGELLLKYPQPGQGDTILRYKATLSSDVLTLEQPGGRLKTVYRRK